MVSFLILTALYFLPSIIGKDKREATGIFLVNLFKPPTGFLRL